MLLILLLGLWLSWRLFEIVLPPPKAPERQPQAPVTPETETPTERPKSSKSPESAKPQTPSSQPTTRFEAFEYINQKRQQAGLTPLTRDANLSRAAAQHARYSVVNDFQGHDESRQMPYFSGQTPTDRAHAEGYHAFVGEVISYNRPALPQFVDDLLSAIYHRLGLLAMDIDVIGTGFARDGIGSVESALAAVTGNRGIDRLCQQSHRPRPGELFYLGVCKNDVKLPVKAMQKAQTRIAKQQPKLLTWPPAGSTVPPVFYEETPDPLPECNASGYPPHIQINPIYQGRIRFVPNSFELTRLEGQQKIPVAAIAQFTNLSDPHHAKAQKPATATLLTATPKESWYAYFPLQRLKWGSRYEARVVLNEQGRLTPVVWQFTTPTLPGLHTLAPRSKKAAIRAHVGETITLYFPPDGCQAPTRAEIQTRLPAHLRLKKAFIDGQTFQFTLTSARVGDRMEFFYAPTATRVQVIVRKPNTQ